MRRFVLPAVLVLGLLLGGCGGPEKAFLGKWNADPNDPNLKQMGASAMAKNMTVEFKPDHTFALSLGFGSLQGSFSVKDKVATLTAKSETAGGQTKALDPKEAQGAPNATISDDGKSLTLAVPNAPASQALTFVKSS